MRVRLGQGKKHHLSMPEAERHRGKLGEDKGTSLVASNKEVSYLCLSPTLSAGGPLEKSY